MLRESFRVKLFISHKTIGVILGGNATAYMYMGRGWLQLRAMSVDKGGVLRTGPYGPYKLS